MERASRSLSADMAAQGSFREWRFPTSSFVLYALWRPARMENVAAPMASPMASPKTSPKTSPDKSKDANHVASHVASQGTQKDASPVTAKSHSASQTLHVYVEGDGLAWESSRRPSRDPTPDTPVVLHLAAADPSKGPVLYLARPCQYVRGDDARLCHTEYWTSGRLSETVIASLNEAVDMAKAHSGATRVVLVGYSGGGGAVALMAARRNDVVFLGTVAGLLDHAAWTAYHKVSPLRTSLNAVDVAARLRALPQRHVTGGKDSNVPAQVNAAFCTAVGAQSSKASQVAPPSQVAASSQVAPPSQVAAPSPAQCLIVPGMAHGDDWAKVWDYRYY